MRVLITGGKGMLAWSLVATAKGKVWAPSKEELDITQPSSIEKAFAAYQPEGVINTAAFTKVDLCEVEQERALKVNMEGVSLLASLCQKTGACLVQISTDYVFGGEKSQPYREDDLAHPINFYGKTKLLGEQQAKICPHHLIVRVSWLFGPGKSNFVTFVKEKLERGETVFAVTDQTSRPSYTLHVAKALWELLENQARGTFHVANEGFTTRYHQALKVAEYLNLPKEKVKPVTTQELFAQKAPRPSYSVLDLSRTKALLQHPLPSWEEGLKAYLQNL